MSHIENAVLHDYIDDCLGPDGRRDVEQHVMQCDDCRMRLAALRGLVTSAGALPKRRTPSKDLWAGVRDATVAAVPVQRRRMPIPHRIYAAAAAAVLLFVTTTILLVDRTEAPVSSAGNQTEAFATYQAAEADYARAAAQLLTIIDEQRTTLDTAVVRTVEENVRAMDEAIDRARAALVNDPSSRDVARILTSTQEAKMQMLRRAVATGET